MRLPLATAVVVGAALLGAAPAAASASDPCPVTIDVTVTAPGSALAEVTAPWGEERVCGPSHSPSRAPLSVFIYVPGRPFQMPLYYDGQCLPCTVPITATPGAEVTVVARRNMDNGGGVLVGFEKVVVRLTPKVSTPPGPVTGAHAWGATDASLAIGWTEPAEEADAGPLAYVVSVGGRTVRVSGTEAIITGLEPATDYEIRIEAQGAAGASPVSVVHAQTAPAGDDELREVGIDPQALLLSPKVDGGDRNTDGSADFDEDPETVRQTLGGAWVRDDDVGSAERAASVRLDEETNAGVEPTVVVSYESPSIADVNVDGETGRFTATLRRGARSGAVVITVTAPAVVTDGIAYEPLSVSRRFVVEAPGLGAWPTAVDQQVTDTVT